MIKKLIIIFKKINNYDKCENVLKICNIDLLIFMFVICIYM